MRTTLLEAAERFDRMAAAVPMLKLAVALG